MLRGAVVTTGFWWLPPEPRDLGGNHQSTVVTTASPSPMAFLKLSRARHKTVKSGSYAGRSESSPAHRPSLDADLSSGRHQFPRHQSHSPALSDSACRLVQPHPLPSPR